MVPENIEVTAAAKSDMSEIWEYIAADSQEAADDQIDRFAEVFAMLSRHPLSGRARDNLSAGLRSFPTGNYLVFYRPVTDGIVIIRVLHGFRNLDELFE